VAFVHNNVNAAGVSGGSAAADPVAAAAVTTGIEFASPFAVGHPAGPIKTPGSSTAAGSNYLSNQVIGGFSTARGKWRRWQRRIHGGAAGIDFSTRRRAPPAVCVGSLLRRRP